MYVKRGLRATIYDESKVEELVSVLKERTLNAKEIGNILQMDKLHRQYGLSRIINTISEHYPIYSPEDGKYRLLTNEVLDDWDKNHRTSLEQLYAEYND